jgi:outer membrane protein assembly factor BamD (BamD/ComL family)
LRSGQIARARSLLGELETRFGRGMLAQEREVLSIELLAASGERRAAAQRARAFIAKHPKSAHAANLARFVDAP